MQVFHAGTIRDAEHNIAAVGGRVLGVSAMGKDVLEAQQNAYKVATWGVSACFLRPCLPFRHALTCCLSDCSLLEHTCDMQAVDMIDWPEGFVRRDIGWRAIERL